MEKILQLEQIANNPRYKSGDEFTAYALDTTGTQRTFSATLSRDYGAPLMFFCIPSNYEIIGYSKI